MTSRWDSLRPDRREGTKEKQGKVLQAVIPNEPPNSPEEIEQVLLDVLLPRLEESQTTRRTLSADERVHLFNAIQNSLKNDAVASSILAPTIIDEVENEDEGSQIQRSNPSGLRLVRCLVSEFQKDNCQAEAIDCLRFTLDIQSRVEGDKPIDGKVVAPEWDPRIVYKLFEDFWQRKATEKMLSVIRLMEVLIRRSSGSSSSLLSAILLPNSLLRSSLDVCLGCNAQLASLSSWMSALHQGISMPATDKALVRCTVKMLESASLSLWLRENTRPSRAKTSITSFRDKIVVGLISMIRICSCRLSRESCTVIDIEWASCLLCQIPYDMSNDLVTQAESLVVKLIFLWRHKKVDRVLETLLKVMGGEITPRGDLTQMPLPLRTWFLSTEGKYLIREILNREVPREDLFEAQFLQRSVRTLPLIILEEHSVWESFVQCIDRWNTSGPVILQALLQGRGDSVQEPLPVQASDIIPDIAPQVKTWMESGDSARKLLALTCYGLLCRRDWDELVTSESFQQHLDLILSFCADEKGGQKSKSEAYKNLGDICSTLIPAYRSLGKVEGVLDFCESACRLFFVGLEGHKNVSYMAMFGLGNLAQALSTTGHKNLGLRSDTVKLLGSLVTARLGSDDPKLASNTIRAASHVVCLSGRDDCDVALSESTLEKVLQSLSWRIQQALSLSCGELSSLSWKQRSAAKKLGWGACNALATIFSNAASSLVHKSPTFENCVQKLFLCLADIKTTNDKIVTAAIAALSRIDPDALGRVIEGKTYFARSFVSVLRSLSPTGREKTKIDGDATFVRLLKVCSISGARDVANELAATSDGLGLLYERMMRSNLAAEHWGKVALSMQRCSSVDIYWEQRFANRAQLLLQPEITDEL
eukprot:scaffold1362_cov163-Amphora_coffeaeformis.AAC.11